MPARMLSSNQASSIPFPNDWFRLGIIPAGSTDAIVLRGMLNLLKFLKNSRFCLVIACTLAFLLLQQIAGSQYFITQGHPTRGGPSDRDWELQLTFPGAEPRTRGSFTGTPSEDRGKGLAP